MEELRIKIWDLLFRLGQSDTVEGIAHQIETEEESVRQAVDHEWFTTAEDKVAISQISDTR